MCLVVSVSFSRQGSHVAITHDTFDFAIQPPPPPGHVQTCSTCTSLLAPPRKHTPCTGTPAIMKHVLLASRRLASSWNAFLFLVCKSDRHRSINIPQKIMYLFCLINFTTHDGPPATTLGVLVRGLTCIWHVSTSQCPD